MTKSLRPVGLNRRQLLWSSAAVLGASAVLLSSTARAQPCDYPVGAQDGWRYCHRCKGLFYGPSGGRAGACPAGLGGHDGSLSFNYGLGYGRCPGPYTQNNWRWCRKCQGLAYGASPQGLCPAGNRHDHTGSFNYLVETWYGGSDNPQSGWWWCQNCHGLHYRPTSDFPFGWCPAGGRHVALGSFPYLMSWGA
jgi:hypothetical protein